MNTYCFRTFRTTGSVGLVAMVLIIGSVLFSCTREQTTSQDASASFYASVPSNATSDAREAKPFALLISGGAYVQVFADPSGPGGAQLASLTRVSVLNEGDETDFSHLPVPAGPAIDIKRGSHWVQIHSSDGKDNWIPGLYVWPSSATIFQSASEQEVAGFSSRHVKLDGVDYVLD